MLKITDVRVRKLSQEGKMRAIVSVSLEDVFVIHDIKVIEGQNGLFIAMPSRKVGDGKFRDIAHPISAQMRDYLQSQILQAYQETRQKLEAYALDQGEAEIFSPDENLPLYAWGAPEEETEQAEPGACESAAQESRAESLRTGAYAFDTDR